jgi:multidrug resistance efflux pump
VPSGNLPDVPRLQNWVPPSQRFQVRLALDDADTAPLRVGTTCTVTTIVDPDSPIMPVTRFLHELVALWYYL